MQRLIILTVVLSFSLWGCRNEHGHPHEEDGHEHEQEMEALSYTVWTEQTELFVEFKPLVVGQSSAFAAHFTDMHNFKAIEEGSVTVSLVKDGKGIRQTVEAPVSPGIFRPSLQPKEEGMYQLIFDIISGTIKDKIVIDSVRVFENEAAAIAVSPAEGGGGEISFLKEQAWKIDFAIEQAKKGEIHQVIKASGKLEPMQGDETVINAKTSGIVLFNKASLYEGYEANSGELLFIISGGGITDGNIESRFAVAKAEYEKAKADYERGKELVEEQIISQKAFDDIKTRYEVAQAEWQNIVAGYGKGGQQIKAPYKGFIKQVMVREGQYVESGEALATISKNKRLIMQVDVSQKYFADLPVVTTANFKPAYDDTVYAIEDFNGKILSYGKSAGKDANYLPVFFELDNKGNLLPGAFVEVYLKTRPLENTVVIPTSALMEDYENYYVYVQTAGESFEKRNLKIGVNDGRQVQVLSGLEESEWVVTRGAYQVKMASMSSTIPAHGHSH